MPSVQFFRDASQVAYDVSPTDPATLSGTSALIVSGRAESISANERRGSSQAEGVAVVQLKIEKVHKGDGKVDRSVFFVIDRAGIVSD
jgi:hypothetical protein